MRQRLIDELTFLARKDSRIVLLTADLGFGVLDKFASEFLDLMLEGNFDLMKDKICS